MTSRDVREAGYVRPSSGDFLRWLYVGRLTVVSGVLAAALLSWGTAHPHQTLITTMVFVVGVGVTSCAFWWTHILGRMPTDRFSYGQALLDAVLVTGIVFVTGGAESPFAPLYILVIAEGALLLPISGGVLVGTLTSLLFVGQAVVLQDSPSTATVALQMGLFGAVAVTVGVLADRMRHEGLALGRLESELRQLRVDTDEILNNIGTGILTVDERGDLVFVNPVGEAFLGLSGDEFRGRSALALLDEVAPGLGQLVRRSMNERKPLSRFRTVVGNEGESITLGVSTTVFTRAGDGPWPVTAIFQDITDVERLEGTRRRNERLEAVTELSASLAHEIKNPLASILSAVEQLASDRLSSEDRATLRDLVVAQSQRLSRLLSEFIDFSVLEIGPRSEFDLAELVGQAVALVCQHPEAKDVRLTTVGIGAPVMVPGDADMVHRALFNLILNASQFAGIGGEVEVDLRADTTRLYMAETDVPSPVRVQITDSGPGICANDLGRVFDPFYTTREGGSGLGLAVVHRTAAAHNGAVFVEAAPKGGARFVLILPGTAEGHDR